MCAAVHTRGRERGTGSESQVEVFACLCSKLLVRLVRAAFWRRWWLSWPPAQPAMDCTFTRHDTRRLWGGACPAVDPLPCTWALQLQAAATACSLLQRPSQATRRCVQAPSWHACKHAASGARLRPLPQRSGRLLLSGLTINLPSSVTGGQAWLCGLDVAALTTAQGPSVAGRTT